MRTNKVKRVLLIIFSIIISLIIIIISANYFIKYRIKSEIERTLSESFSAHIFIDKIEINWFKGIIKIDDINAFSNSGTIPKPLFTIDNISLSLNLENVQDINQLNFKQISTSNSNFYIYIDRYGNSNWNIQTPNIEADIDITTPKININKICLDNITLKIYDNFNKSKYLINNINFEYKNLENLSKEFYLLIENINIEQNGLDYKLPRIEVQGKATSDSLNNSLYKTNIRLNHFFAETKLELNKENNRIKFNLNSQNISIEDFISMFVSLDECDNEFKFEGFYSSDINIEFSTQNGFEKFQYQIKFENSKIENISNNTHAVISGISSYEFKINSGSNRYDSVYVNIQDDSLKYLFNSKNIKNNYALGALNLNKISNLLGHENIQLNGILQASNTKSDINKIETKDIFLTNKYSDTLLNCKDSYIHFGRDITAWSLNLYKKQKEIFSHKGQFTQLTDNFTQIPELYLFIHIPEIKLQEGPLPKSINLNKPQNNFINLSGFKLHYPQSLIFKILIKIDNIDLQNIIAKELELNNIFTNKELTINFSYNNDEENYQNFYFQVNKISDSLNKVNIKNNSKLNFSDNNNYINLGSIIDVNLLLSDSLNIIRNSINGKIEFKTNGIKISNQLIYSTFPIIAYLFNDDMLKISGTNIKIKINNSNFTVQPFNVKIYKAAIHAFGEVNPHDSINFNSLISLNPHKLNFIERKIIKLIAREKEFSLDSIQGEKMLNMILKITGDINKPETKLIFMKD